MKSLNFEILRTRWPELAELERIAGVGRQPVLSLIRFWGLIITGADSKHDVKLSFRALMASISMLSLMSFVEQNNRYCLPTLKGS